VLKPPGEDEPVTTSVAERSWCVVVPHHPRGAGRARARLAAELSGIVPPALLADAVSVAAELVGNAIRHARPLPGDVVRVAWKVRHAAGGAAVDIRVTDGGGHTEPLVRHFDPDATDGRGLAIVAALAARWGVERDGLGQTVWAELVSAGGHHLRTP
jgi:anti-sigma regulatory factor (Ser/Thr protein kinase)